jgi:hypothetical protein
MKFSNRFSKTLGFFLASAVSFQAVASTYSFGGSCESNDAWTAKANQQAQSIATALETLRNDPNCQGIETSVVALQKSFSAMAAQPALNSPSKEATDFARMPQDILAMRNLLQTQPSTEVLQAVFGATLDISNLSRIRWLAEGASRAANVGLEFLDQVLVTLPKYNRCLDSNPDQALAILGGTLQLTSAFLASGEGIVSKVGASVGRFVTYLRESKFSDRLRELDRAQYWSSLSCIMETTADSYCYANDAYQMMEMSQKEVNFKQDLQKSEKHSSFKPLEGYFLMVREVPIVSEWLQSVMYGVDPRTPSDASFKQNVQDNVNALVKQRYAIIGQYNYELNLLEGFTLNDAKKTHTLDMLIKLISLIDQTSAGSTINFFHKGMTRELIPFYLIGRDTVPKEVIPQSGGYPVAWNVYMKTGAGGTFIPEFSNPKELAERIGERLTKLMDLALVSASDYFRQQLIIDMENLVARSVTSQTLSVLDSLTNIRSYLARMSDEILAGYGDKALLRHALDTVQKIDFVLQGYESNRKIIAEYLSQADTMSKDELKKKLLEDDKLKKTYEDIITRVYAGFNVLYQRDTFLQTRMHTFVLSDYAYKTKNMENLSEHQRAILTLSGKGLIDRMNSSHKQAPDLVKLDLSNAQTINRRSIEVLQSSFDDKLYSILLELKLIDEGKYTAANMTRESLWSLIQQSVPEKRTFGTELWQLEQFLGKVFYNFFVNRDRYRHPNLFNREHINTDDDDQGSFATMRARLCTQTLMFDNRTLFEGLCKGVELKANFAGQKAAEQSKLNLNYDSMLTNLRMAEASGNSQLVRQTRTQNVCAYYNYKLKNKAYWLLKDLKQD